MIRMFLNGEAMRGGAYSTRAAELVVSVTGYGERQLEAETPMERTTEFIGQLTGLVRALSTAIHGQLTETPVSASQETGTQNDVIDDSLAEQDGSE